jgi:hypothetical protein
MIQGKDKTFRNVILLLQAKNLQLTREVNDLRREVLGKENFVGGVDEDLYKIRDILKRTLSLINQGKKEEGAKELKLTSQYIEALQRQMKRKIKGFKELEESADVQFLSEFIAIPKEATKVTLSDICSGETKHLNLKHVSRLELQLLDLYDCLLELQNSVDVCLIPNLNQKITERQKKIIEKSKQELKDSIESLNSLSVLVPAAPYPKLQKIRSDGIALPSKEEVISRLLPSLSFK